MGGMLIIPWYGKRMPLSGFYSGAYLARAHEASFLNHATVVRSSICGCFYCCKTFLPTQVTGWNWEGSERGASQRGRTAFCPYCDIDSVIGSASGFPITRQFLDVMHEWWFNTGFSAPRETY